MKLRIRSEGFPLTRAIEAFARYRLQCALDRFQGGIDQVRVRLCDENGPRGGLDKRCLLHVDLHGRQPVLIDERDPDLYTAIGRSARRAKRQLAREFGRRRRTALVPYATIDAGAHPAAQSVRVGRGMSARGFRPDPITATARNSTGAPSASSAVVPTADHAG